MIWLQNIGIFLMLSIVFLFMVAVVATLVLLPVVLIQAFI